jgi:hypothetical protein
LNNTFQNINRKKKNAFLIIGICISAILIKFLVEDYRGSWIYQFGSLYFLFMFYGGILWSIINTVLLISEHKSDLKKNLIWILISALPILYITIMITIAMTKTID